MSLPVVFAIDRAGIVGEDGETHQGAFDISFLRAIPNMILFAPFNETSMVEAMRFASILETPCSFRYPRGSFMASEYDIATYELGKGEIIKEGSDIALIGYGNGVGRALEVAKLLECNPTVVDLRFVKPLDGEMLKSLSLTHKQWFVFSDSVKMGGVGSTILEFLSNSKIKGVDLVTFEYDDEFVTHGSTTLVEESLGLLPMQLAQKINEIIGEK
jgi:1-deoxy-D-xylulose-5-phosphate synthase